MSAEAQAEFSNRLKYLPELDHSMGPSFTLAKHSMKALQKSAPEKVNWDEIHKKTVVESIQVHGQDPDDVFDAIAKFSPGAIDESVREKLRKAIDTIAPDLAKRYDEVRAKEDAEAEAEKRANGGVIKFKKA
jgi:MinD-like ATPase involved in chromosome partitioning or flagellar assembly